MATDESAQLIDRLTREVGALRQANLDLQNRVEGQAAPQVRAPDELASALRITVDRLANELASLSNPISNFAVKDFKLETNVAVSITDFGNIEYRLLQPGANVDPSSVSRLTISLAPIEKRPAGTLSPGLFEPEKDLGTIGISEPLRAVFERNHIFTLSDFRAAVNRARVRTSLLASVTSPHELATLQARAELVLLAGVDLALADTLIAAKIDSLQALARSTPEGLLLLLRHIDRAQLLQWIEAARSFTGIDPANQPQHIVGIRTNPAGLLVRLAGDAAFSRVPVMQQLPAARPVVVETIRAQLTETGVGHAFTGWSTGGDGRQATILSAKDIDVTAGFRQACHSVIAASVSRGGSVTLSPAVGGVPGFPAHCYAAGTRVQIVATPELGYGLKGLSINAAGATRTVTSLRTAHVVAEPVVARATFVPRPQTISTIFPPVRRADGHLQSQVFFANPTPTPGRELRVTAVRFETTGGTGTIALTNGLPLEFGELPADGRSRDQQLVYDVPREVTTFNIFLTVKVTNADGDVFTNQVSIGHMRPV